MHSSIRKHFKVRLGLLLLSAAAAYGSPAPAEFVPLEGTAYDVADSASLRTARLTEYHALLDRAREFYLSGGRRETSDRLGALKMLLAEDDLVADSELRLQVDHFARLLSATSAPVRLPGPLSDSEGLAPDSTFYIFEWREHPPQLDEVEVAPGEYALLVDKSDQHLYVYQYGNSWDLVRTYECTTGKSSGDKLKAGDMRTPEGTYYFNHIFEARDLHSIYGIRAFVTDYPASIDIKRGKSGDGIWLHGLDRPLVPEDTNGCIALRNRDVMDVSGYIKLSSTPLVISRKLSRLGPTVRSYPLERIIGFLETLRSAWESRDVAAFEGLHSAHFLGGGGEREAYFRHKRELAAEYDWIKVDMSDVVVAPEHDRVEVSFIQAYSSPVYRDRGRKRLILRLEKDGWRIWDEIWEG